MSSFLVIQLNSQLLSCLFKSNYFHALTLTMKLAFSVFITSSTLHSYFFCSDPLFVYVYLTFVYTLPKFEF